MDTKQFREKLEFIKEELLKLKEEIDKEELVAKTKRSGFYNRMCVIVGLFVLSAVFSISFGIGAQFPVALGASSALINTLVFQYGLEKSYEKKKYLDFKGTLLENEYSKTEEEIRNRELKNLLSTKNNDVNLEDEILPEVVQKPERNKLIEKLKDYLEIIESAYLNEASTIDYEENSIEIAAKQIIIRRYDKK